MSLQQRIARLSALLVGCALLPVNSFAQLSFQPSQPAQISSSATIVFHGDFNNDGREDLIVAGYETTSPYTFIDQIYLSNGNGTYQAPITLPALAQAIGDFNGDGKLDFAEVDPHSGQIDVYLGNGDGTFQSPKITAGAGTGFNNLVAVDLNHDSKTDLVEVLNISSSSGPSQDVQVWISNGDGTFSKGQTIVAYQDTSGGSICCAITGDFDGDGKPDIALAHVLATSDIIQVLYGDGAGHLGSSYIATDPDYIGVGPYVAADLYNNGRSDIILTAAESGPRYGDVQFLPMLRVFTGNSDRTLSYTTIATNQCAGPVAVADFNGDGINDLAFSETSCNLSNNIADLAIKLGQGSGSFGAEQSEYQDVNNYAPYGYTSYAVRSTLGTKPDILFSESNATNPITSFIELLANISVGAFPGCGPSGFAEGVQICTPGATSTSPVKFSVGTAGPTPMRTAAVWADGKKVAEQLTHAFSNYSFLDASVPLAAGSHSITVYGTGWDNTLQKKSFTLNVGGGTCSAPTSAGVHICQPASGASISSPVTIQATSTITGKFDRMEVWVDGVKEYTETSGTALNTTLNVSAGTHRFGIFAVNTAGTKWKQVVYATVK